MRTCGCVGKGELWKVQTLLSCMGMVWARGSVEGVFAVIEQGQSAPPKASCRVRDSVLLEQELLAFR